jgi:hypothetical protein
MNNWSDEETDDPLYADRRKASGFGDKSTRYGHCEYHL